MQISTFSMVVVAMGKEVCLKKVHELGLENSTDPEPIQGSGLQGFVAGHRGANGQIWDLNNQPSNNHVSHSG